MLNDNAPHAYTPPTQEQKDKEDAQLWRDLIELCGTYHDGSDTTVSFFQDDATRSCGIKVGNKTYIDDGASFARMVRRAAGKE